METQATTRLYGHCLIVMLLALVVGCRSPDAGESERWEVGAPWHLEEDLRLGGSGDSVAEFGRVVCIREDSRGRIYVADDLSHRVVVFSPAGEVLHTIGRGGSGPGEFATITGMALSAGDTLWIMDGRLNRYSEYAPDGSLVGVRRRKLGGAYEKQAGTFLRDGTYVDWRYGKLSGPDGKPRYSFEPVLLSHSLDALDTFPSVDFPMELTDDGRPQVFFAADLWMWVDRKGDVWFANGRDYRLSRRTLSGDTTLTVSLSVEPAPVTEGDRDTVSSPPYLHGLASTKPVIDGVFGDNAGDIFVVPEVEGVPVGSAVDVFEDSGRYLGRMALPHRLTITHMGTTAYATERHLYFAWMDKRGVPYVSRARIVKGEG